MHRVLYPERVLVPHPAHAVCAGIEVALEEVQHSLARSLILRLWGGVLAGLFSLSQWETSAVVDLAARQFPSSVAQLFTRRAPLGCCLWTVSHTSC